MCEPCSFWNNPDGIDLACYEWKLKLDDPKFVFYICHGYADRLNAYSKLIEMILDSGGVIYSHDHFAHGKSGPYPKDHPKRCQLDLYHTARDLNLRVEEIKKKHPNIPLVMLGHSLGGLISALMVKDNPENIDGLIFEAPSFKLHEASVKWYHILGAKILNRIAPEFKLGGGDVNLVSRYKDVCNEFDRLEPEYGDNGGMMARTAYHMLEVQKKLMTVLNQIQVNTLFCHGTDDRICSIEGSRHGHNQMTNSKLKTYDGAYHCLHDELPETTDAFLSDVKKFIHRILQPEI